MKRIFIAVKVVADSNFTGHISSVKSRLSGESIKWTDPGNIHITLAFLGNTQEIVIPLLENMLKEKCSGFGSFESILSGFGIFKSLRDPRIIWTGIEQTEKLKELHTIIAKGLKDVGIVVEDRPFSPHLTLGRIKHIEDIESLKNLLEKYNGTEMQKVPVNEVILYESILKQTGPVYKPISVYKL